jgi:hypothetical protein
MLRDCGFAHIGEMLAQLLSADVQGRPDDDTMAIPFAPVTTARPNLSALTEKQAIAIGCAIASSVHRSLGSGMHNSGRPNQDHALAMGLNKVVQSHGALQAMKSEYAWFMPMLEVAVAHKIAQRRGSAVISRGISRGISRLKLRSSISPVASSDGARHADAVDEESGFSPVVRLGAPHAPFCCARTSW